MNWEAILQNILISGLVSGIIIFVFQQWVSRRFKKMENLIKFELNNRQNKINETEKIFRELWKKLLDIEKFAQKGGITGGDGGEVDISFLYETHHFLRENSPILPDNLYNKIKKLIDNYIIYLNLIIKEINAAKVFDTESFEYKERLIKIGQMSKKSFEDYQLSLDKMRAEYKEIMDKLIKNNS